jgi:hypothetical protein
MIYVCLDTCIYIHIVTQGQPENSTECFDELRQLAKGGRIRVVVPEVVVLEFEKFRQELDSKFSSSIKQLGEAIVNACAKEQKQWNEIDDLRQSLAPHIEAEAAKKKAAFPGRIKAVSDWLHSGDVVPVPYDSEIMLKAKRRLISGRMPPSERKSDQDASIIECLVKALPTGEELYFCSGNTNDFGLDLGKKGFALHPLLAEDLPKTKYFVNLCSLVETIKSGKAPPEPTPEEVKEAAREEAIKYCTGDEAIATATSLENKLKQFRIYRFLRRCGVERHVIFHLLTATVNTPEELVDLARYSLPKEACAYLTTQPMDELLHEVNALRECCKYPPVRNPATRSQ